MVGLRMVMRSRIALIVVPLLALAACTTTEGPTVETTATVAAPAPAPSRAPDEPKDDVTLGKEHFRAKNYGLAELHFRRAVESSGSDAEAWLGLAASYDQLRRFRLAERAYKEALARMGSTSELLNNRGYSYMLRGDFRKASRDLSEASAKDPDNEQIRNNLQMLDQKARGRI
jgi:Flp pilus assembly protein TadD